MQTPFVGHRQARLLDRGATRPLAPDLISIHFRSESGPDEVNISLPNQVRGLSGPTATVILSHYTVALHSGATLCRTTLVQSLEGRRRRIVLHPLKGPCSTYLFSSRRRCSTSSCLLKGVALQGGFTATLSPVAPQWAT